MHLRISALFGFCDPQAPEPTFPLSSNTFVFRLTASRRPSNLIWSHASTTSPTACRGAKGLFFQCCFKPHQFRQASSTRYVPPRGVSWDSGSTTVMHTPPHERRISPPELEITRYKNSGEFVGPALWPSGSPRLQPVISHANHRALVGNSGNVALYRVCVPGLIRL